MYDEPNGTYKAVRTHSVDLVKAVHVELADKARKLNK